MTPTRSNSDWRPRAKTVLAAAKTSKKPIGDEENSISADPLSLGDGLSGRQSKRYSHLFLASSKHLRTGTNERTSKAVDKADRKLETSPLPGLVSQRYFLWTTSFATICRNRSPSSTSPEKQRP